MKMKKKNFLREKKYVLSKAQGVRMARELASEPAYRIGMSINSGTHIAVKMAKRLARYPY